VAKEEFMYCSKCGASLVESAAYCAACGQPTSAVADTGAAYPVPVAVAVPLSAPPIGVAMPYAGFWLRFVAAIIDGVVTGAVFGAIVGLLAVPLGLASMSHDPEQIFAALSPVIFFLWCGSFVAQWLYFALLESSSWQGTLGKKALGLIVTDMMGKRISFARATGRHFAKIISGMILLIGYLMAGFTERKQALHDMIAGCLVFRKT
jgi:uncharacterized RDD family membrane protein YckC